jgi:kynurenine/2-aminoadipate aminotransferase
LQDKIHGLSNHYWDTNDILITTGSQDGLCKAIEMSLEDGEPILVQEPIYSGATAIVIIYII